MTLESLKTTHRFWGQRKFYCPHCKKTFTYERMWKRLFTDLKSAKAVMKILDLSAMMVRSAVLTFGGELTIIDSQRSIGWRAKARQLGYPTVREMFFDLRVMRNISYKKIAQMLSADRDATRKACLYHIQPKGYHRR